MNKKIALACSICQSRNYSTHKSVHKDTARLEVNKFCKKCRKHTLHRETK